MQSVSKLLIGHYTKFIFPLSEISYFWAMGHRDYHEWPPFWNRYSNSAQKVLEKAKECLNLEKDEEKAYILLMRYLDLCTAIQKTDEYKKNTVGIYSVGIIAEF